MAMHIPEDTSEKTMVGQLARLKENAYKFARLPIDDKLTLLQRVREAYQSVAEASVRAACEAKGHDFEAPVSGEEWLGGPVITQRIMRLTYESLCEVRRWGSPQIANGHIEELDDGRLKIKVFPHGLYDRALLMRHEAYVFMQAGIDKGNLKEHQAVFYQKPHGGRLTVVLGGGNVNAIAPTDVIYKMFVEGAVCLLKMNPVNAYLGPFLETAFQALIERGFLAICYGGASQGQFLARHDAVDEVHVTGSEKTYDALMWGMGDDRDARKNENRPVTGKTISSELGNITPIIVVPYAYSGRDLEYLANSTAGMVCNNASFNCNSAKLLVTSAKWKQRSEFLEFLARGMAKGGIRRAYYPGAAERFQKFTSQHEDVRIVGTAQDGQLPYAIISNVDHQAVTDISFCNEPWCTVISETAFEQENVKSFFEAVVPFVNESVWGTLCAGILVHPGAIRSGENRTAFERACVQLKYGSVAINSWPAAQFALGQTPWGGHPSSTAQNVQSGRGFVHNTLMLEGIEKSVLHGPLKMPVAPPWWPGHKSVNRLAEALNDFEFSPSLGALTRMGVSAIRS